MRCAPWIALCLVLPDVAHAEWYTWRDASGALHVTDQLSDPRVSSPTASKLAYGSARAAALGASVAPATGQPTTTRSTHPQAAAPGSVDERRRRVERRLQANLAHLALLRAAPPGDAQRAGLENELNDAVREDSATLAAGRTETAQ